MEVSVRVLELPLLPCKIRTGTVMEGVGAELHDLWAGEIFPFTEELPARIMEPHDDAGS